jgi:hypothetical protein
LRQHAEGTFMTEMIFGSTIMNADGRVIPVRWMGAIRWLDVAT